MKRTFSVVLCMLLLCSLLLLGNVGITKAYLSGYSYIEYTGFTISFDGKWTTGTEWTSAPWRDISANAKFAGIFDMADGMYQYNIIEFLTDTSNDPEDYWQICLQNTAQGPTLPSTSSFKIEFVGHTTLRVYRGNGAGWDLLAAPPAGFAIKNTFGSSPMSSTPHWTCEVQIDKAGSPVNIQPPLGIRVAVYDASNAAAGVQSWPPTSVSSVDNPSQWGSISEYGGEIPETFGIIAIVLLSSLAVAGAFALRKRLGVASLAKLPVK